MDPNEALLADLIAHEDLRPLVQQLLDHDPGTYRHSLRVARFAIYLGRADGLSDHALEELAVAALLHDLGKLAVEPDIVNKPGPLDPDERAAMEDHARAATAEIASLPLWPNAHRIAPLHHELGSDHAYPRSGGDRRELGRGGSDRRRPLDDDLVRAGRILALADRYDALISRRPYKGPIDPARVKAVLAEEAPDLAHLLEALPDFGHSPR